MFLTLQEMSKRSLRSKWAPLRTDCQMTLQLQSDGAAAVGLSVAVAEEVGVDIFVIATDVPGAALNYGQAEQMFLRSMTLEEASQVTGEAAEAAAFIG